MLQVETSRRIRPKHPSNMYLIWKGMKQRCLNSNNPAYRDYGGRGIKVCDRWLVFANFEADMGPRPAGLSIDRIDNDGNYEPGNCRWATALEQRHNRRVVQVTACKWGHPFSPDNTFYHTDARGYVVRRCRACYRRRTREWYQRKAVS